MAALLVVVLFNPIKSILLGLRSKEWRKTKATVATSELDRMGGVYYPKIIYKYTVNGREFINDSYTFSGISTDGKLRALALVRGNPIGKELSIYVDPEDSSRSVVVPGVHWSAYANIFLLVALFAGIAFIVDILNFVWPGCEPNCT